MVITCFKSYSSSSVVLCALLVYASTCDSYCVHFKLSTFMAVEQRGVSLGAEAAACSRGPVPGSPYPIQLGFVIGSPGLKDTVHHLTRLNACKMSNQRCVWSLRPRQASFLQTFTAGPRGPPPMISRSDLCFPSHEISGSGFIYVAGTDVGAHHTSNMLNIPFKWKCCWLQYNTQHCFMGADICGLFMVSEVSLHWAWNDTPTDSANMWFHHFFPFTQHV